VVRQLPAKRAHNLVVAGAGDVHAALVLLSLGASWVERNA
jgi:hypothetical protein